MKLIVNEVEGGKILSIDEQEMLDGDEMVNIKKSYPHREIKYVHVCEGGTYVYLGLVVQ